MQCSQTLNRLQNGWEPRTSEIVPCSTLSSGHMSSSSLKNHPNPSPPPDRSASAFAVNRCPNRCNRGGPLSSLAGAAATPGAILTVETLGCESAQCCVSNNASTATQHTLTTTSVGSLAKLWLAGCGAKTTLVATTTPQGGR